MGELMAKFQRKALVVEMEQYAHGQPKPTGLCGCSMNHYPHTHTQRGMQLVYAGDWLEEDTLANHSGVKHYIVHPDAEVRADYYAGPNLPLSRQDDNVWARTPGALINAADKQRNEALDNPPPDQAAILAAEAHQAAYEGVLRQIREEPARA